MYDVVATIGIADPVDKTVKYVYVKEDGLPDYTAVLLMAEYDTKDKVMNLIKKGSINKLPMYAHLQFMSEGDQFVCPLVDYLDIDEDLDGMGEEYRYLFNKDKWECYDCYWEETVESFKMDDDEEGLECFDNEDIEGKFDIYKYQKILNKQNYPLIMKALSNRTISTYMLFSDYIEMKAWNIRERRYK